MSLHWNNPILNQWEEQSLTRMLRVFLNCFPPRVVSVVQLGAECCLFAWCVSHVVVSGILHSKEVMLPDSTRSACPPEILDPNTWYMRWKKVGQPPFSDTDSNRISQSGYLRKKKKPVITVTSFFWIMLQFLLLLNKKTSLKLQVRDMGSYWIDGIKLANIDNQIR